MEGKEKKRKWFEQKNAGKGRDGQDGDRKLSVVLEGRRVSGTGVKSSALFKEKRRKTKSPGL
jgi:hypothetical protein